MKYRRLGWAAFTFLIAMSIVAPLVIPTRAAASPDPGGSGDIVAKFLDRAHIELLVGANYKGAEGIYYDQDLNDESFNYKQGGPDKKAGVTNNCQSQINVDNGNFPTNDGSAQERKGKLKLKIPASAAGGGDKCQAERTIDILITDTKIGGTDGILFKRNTDFRARGAPGFTSSIIYFKQDATTIYESDNDPNYDANSSNDHTFKVDTAKPVEGNLPAYYMQSKNPRSNCPDVLTNADFGSPTDAHYYQLKKDGDNCVKDPKAFVTASGPASFIHALVLQQRPDAFSTVAIDPGDTDNVEDNCPVPTWGLRWAFCPLIVASQASVQLMDKLNQALLVINADEIFDTNKETGKAYFSGFRAFQTIAFSIIVIVALILVIGTSAGFELLDAYTMRKAAPRFLFAVAGLVLLWPGLEFVVRFFDNMTNWTGDIIAAPFRSLGGNASLGFTEIAAQWIIGGTAIAAFGILGLIMMAASLLLSILTLVLILLGRKILILACILMAPVAVICSVLPNTQVVWKLWRSVFLPAEAAGIVIAAVEGAGIAAARIAKVSNDQLGDSAAVIIIILTQFLLVGSLRRVGGAFATFTGSLDERRRGLNAGLANARRNRAQQRFQAMRRGDLYSNSNPLAKGFNTATRTANNVVGSAALSPARWRRKYAQTQDQQAEQAANAIMQTQGFKDIANNDDALTALRYGSEGEAVRELTKRWGDSKRARDAVAAAQAAGLKLGTVGAKVAGARQRVSTGTGYDDMADLAETLGDAAGNNESLGKRLAGFANAETKKVGRNDLAPGYGALNKLVQSSMNGNLNNREVNDAVIEAAMGTDNATLMRNKPVALKNFSEALNQGFETAQIQAQRGASIEIRQAAQAQMAEIGGKLENMRDSGIYAPEVNLKAMAKGVQSTDAEREGVMFEIKNPEIQIQRPVYKTDSAGRVVMQNGQPVLERVERVTVPNPSHGPEQAAGRAAYGVVRNRQQYRDANDQNLPFNQP